jgi:hypothetical protein
MPSLFRKQDDDDDTEVDPMPSDAVAEPAPSNAAGGASSLLAQLEALRNVGTRWFQSRTHLDYGIYVIAAMFVAAIVGQRRADVNAETETGCWRSPGRAVQCTGRT